MPKMRTNRSAAKRFRVTGTGKIRRAKAFGSHLLTKKSRSRKRRLGKSSLIDRADVKRVKRMIGG